VVIPKTWRCRIKNLKLRKNPWAVDAMSLDALRTRLAWRSTLFGKAPAKTSVAIRRRLAKIWTRGAPLFRTGTGSSQSQQPAVSAAEIGIAHHTFYSCFTAQVGNQHPLQEADRIEQEQLLTSDQRAALTCGVGNLLDRKSVKDPGKRETGST